MSSIPVRELTPGDMLMFLRINLNNPYVNVVVVLLAVPSQKAGYNDYYDVTTFDTRGYVNTIVARSNSSVVLLSRAE